MINEPPLVSIGFPVFNSESTIKKALDSLINQSYKNIEILISDNGSTDNTLNICELYSQQDSRVKLFQQETNMGPGKNYQKVLDESQGKYFMWAASDDYRSLEFIELNTVFLENNPAFVASTSPNCMEGDETNIITFALLGDKFTRFKTFLNNAWSSHGIFYSLMRTDVIRKCDIVDQFFLGTDWAVDLFLASNGQVARLESGNTIFGVKGISNSANVWSRFRESNLEWFLPFYKFSKYTVSRLSNDLTMAQRFILYAMLVKLNFKASYSQVKSEFKTLVTKNTKMERA